MVEQGRGSPENWTSLLQRIKESQRLEARMDLLNARRLQLTSFLRIQESLTSKTPRQELLKDQMKDYRDGVVGVMKASIRIGLQKVANKERLVDPNAELNSRSNLIGELIGLQSGIAIESEKIRRIIEGVGFDAPRVVLINKIAETMGINLQSKEGKVVVQAVRFADKSIAFTKKIQKREGVGVKDDPREY